MAAWVSYFPLYVDGTCLYDFRKLACGLVFTAASEIDTLDSYFGPQFMPSFPHYSVCTNFMSSCSGWLTLAPGLGMDCNMSAGTIRLFPDSIQTLMTVNYGDGDINLQSPPNMMENVTFEIHTECPYSMTVPEDPHNDVVWIDGTGCALACPFPFYTKQEINEQYGAYLASQWTSVLMMGIANYNYFVLTSPAKRNLYYGMMMVCITLLSVLNVLVMSGRKDNEIICENDSTWYSKHDATDSALSFSCAFTGVFNLWYDWMLYFIFSCQAIELWLRVVLSMKDITFLRKVYIGVNLFITLFFILFNLFYGNSDVVGKGGFQLMCTWANTNNDYQYYYTTIPHIIVYTISGALTTHSLYTLYKIATATSSQSFEKLWNSFRAIILGSAAVTFTFPFILFYANTYYGYTNLDVLVDNLVEWIVCLIVNFKSEDDHEYLSTCGMYPSERVPSYLFYILFGIFYYAAPMLMLWISFNAESRAVWVKNMEPYMGVIQPVLDLLAPIFSILSKIGPNINVKDHPEENSSQKTPQKVVVKEAPVDVSKKGTKNTTPTTTPRSSDSKASVAGSVIGMVAGITTGSAKVHVGSSDVYKVVDHEDTNV